MAIFTIGDLHLSFGTDKPMDIFGWGNHSEKIKKNWIENVKSQDTVIIPGDFSWGMSLKETYQDFEFLNNLPGRKILSKGNHDYWWNTLTKMTKFLEENDFENIAFLQNNSYFIENKIIAGTRGWATNNWNSEENYKILKRENDRLKLSIQDGIAQFGKDKEIICFLHYPPFFGKPQIIVNTKSKISTTNYKGNVPEEIDFVKTMKQSGIKRCYYGHLHGEAHREAFEGEIEEIKFTLVSSDYLGFQLKLIKE